MWTSRRYIDEARHLGSGSLWARPDFLLAAVCEHFQWERRGLASGSFSKDEGIFSNRSRQQCFDGIRS